MSKPVKRYSCHFYPVELDDVGLKTVRAQNYAVMVAEDDYEWVTTLAMEAVELLKAIREDDVSDIRKSHMQRIDALLAGVKEKP